VSLEIPPTEVRKSRATAWAIGLGIAGLVMGSTGFLFGAGALIYAGVSAQTDSQEVDLYAAPIDLQELIDRVRESTVTIRCGDTQGSGWAIDLGAPVDKSDDEAMSLYEEYPYSVITNDHVIEDCHDKPGKVRAQAGDEEYDAYLYSWDSDNDLALVAIKQEVPYLPESTRPEPGWWVMAVGTPYGLEGSISVGNVMNTERYDVYATSPLNSGNSGGPLVNAQGEVVGTNTWVMVDEGAQDWNVAVGLPALCDVIVSCEEDDKLGWGDTE